MNYRQPIIEHLETHVGPVETVWQTENLEILAVCATEERPFHVLATCGLSDLEMSAPDGKAHWKRAELCVLVAPNWPLEPKKWPQSPDFWPVGQLLRVANLPFQTDAFLGYGHTIPNGNPPRPFAPQTQLCCWMLLPPASLEPEFASLALGGEQICFWGLTALNEEELALKLKSGAFAVLRLFGEREISDILEPDRESAFRQKNNVKRWLFGA